MTDKEKNSTMKGFGTNDQADYYSGITSIIVNGKNAYELKGKFLNDLHNNAFSGTNGEDVVKHIEYFLKLIETNLFDYETPLCEKFKEFNYLLKIDPDFLTNDIVGFKTYDEYKDYWIYEWNNNVPWVYEKPWTDTRVWTKPTPVVHCCKPFNYKNGCSKWPTYRWREDGYCNGGNLPAAYIVGNTLCYQDLEWYDALKDSELKEEALRNKAIIEGLINEDVESNNEDDGRHELCGNETHELPVCNIRRFEMIKYSFGQDEEYAAVKENEYEDLTNTSKDACRAYQEIFRMMDEGWMVTRTEWKEAEGKRPRCKEIDNVGELSTNLEIWKCWSLETSRRMFNTNLAQ
ncbi:hypothetical protein Tco_1417865 [Tanacetum coccineum]